MPPRAAEVDPISRSLRGIAGKLAQWAGQGGSGEHPALASIATDLAAIDQRLGEVVEQHADPKQAAADIAQSFRSIGETLAGFSSSTESP
jgi:hypothetical protein